MKKIFLFLTVLFGQSFLLFTSPFDFFKDPTVLVLEKIQNLFKPKKDMQSLSMSLASANKEESLDSHYFQQQVSLVEETMTHDLGVTFQKLVKRLKRQYPSLNDRDASEQVHIVFHDALGKRLKAFLLTRGSLLNDDNKRIFVQYDRSDLPSAEKALTEHMVYIGTFLKTREDLPEKQDIVTILSYANTAIDEGKIIDKNFIEHHFWATILFFCIRKHKLSQYRNSLTNL